MNITRMAVSSGIRVLLSAALFSSVVSTAQAQQYSSQRIGVGRIAEANSSTGGCPAPTPDNIEMGLTWQTIGKDSVCYTLVTAHFSRAVEVKADDWSIQNQFLGKFAALQFARPDSAKWYQGAFSNQPAQFAPQLAAMRSWLSRMAVINDPNIFVGPVQMHVVLPTKKPGYINPADWHDRSNNELDGSPSSGARFVSKGFKNYLQLKASAQDATALDCLKNWGGMSEQQKDWYLGNILSGNGYFGLGEMSMVDLAPHIVNNASCAKTINDGKNIDYVHDGQIALRAWQQIMPDSVVMQSKGSCANPVTPLQYRVSQVIVSKHVTPPPPPTPHQKVPRGSVCGPAGVYCWGPFALLGGILAFQHHGSSSPSAPGKTTGNPPPRP